MTKGMQNRDSKIALTHVLQSEGKFRKCGGIFHKGYSNGELVSSQEFKRLGEKDYQSFCSTCDTARQNFQKTLKRLAAILMVEPDFQLNLPTKYFAIEDLLKTKINSAKETSNNPIEFYTKLVLGKEKLDIRSLGFYNPAMNVDDKKSIITLITSKVRTFENRKKIDDFFKSVKEKFMFKCSSCKKILSLSNVTTNISQSRLIFDNNSRALNLVLPIHNMCNSCMQGSRSETLRYYRFLCDGDFIGANRAMTSLGKAVKNSKVHIDHVVPLRLGGKHDPKNLRKFPGADNIEKKDKLTPEAVDYLNQNKISMNTVLSHKYLSVYNNHKGSKLEVIEAALRSAVDDERKRITDLPLVDKDQEIKKLYPLLNPEERARIIRKFFS